MKGKRMKTRFSGKNGKWSLKLVSVLTVICLLFSGFFVPASADDEEDETVTYTPDSNSYENWPEAEDVYCQSCVLIDAETGAVLCSLNRNTTRYPASTTKIMTALLTVENCSLDETVTMTAEGVALVTDDSSNAGTSVGEEFTVEQCLYMLLLKSANDIATQLAVHVAGSIDAFADMMNARAEELGCTGTHFHNPSGMPDEEHYTTAMDLALIMRAVIKNETLRKIISTYSYTVPATNMMSEERYYENHNQLINSNSEYYYEYCIGGKTGFTEAAQRTLVSAAEKDGHTLICVTMKTPDKSDYYDQKRLYNFGFDNFKWTSVGNGTIVLPEWIDTTPFETMFPEYSGQTSSASAETAESGIAEIEAVDVEAEPVNAAADAAQYGSGTISIEAPAAVNTAADAAQYGSETIYIEAPKAVYADENAEEGTETVEADLSGASESGAENSAADTSSAGAVRTVTSDTEGYTAEETDLGDGTVRIVYYYYGTPVGSETAVKPTPEPVSEAAAAESQTETTEKTGNTGNAGGGMKPLAIVLLVLLAAVVLALAVILVMRYRKIVEAQRAEERARRKEQRKKEAAKAWENVSYDDSDDWEVPEDEPADADTERRPGLDTAKKPGVLAAVKNSRKKDENDAASKARSHSESFEGQDGEKPKGSSLLNGEDTPRSSAGQTGGRTVRSRVQSGTDTLRNTAGQAGDRTVRNRVQSENGTEMQRKPRVQNTFAEDGKSRVQNNAEVLSRAIARNNAAVQKKKQSGSSGAASPAKVDSKNGTAEPSGTPAEEGVVKAAAGSGKERAVEVPVFQKSEDHE